MRAFAGSMTALTQVDKRFDQIDLRFAQVDARFEQVDARIDELQREMNRRFDSLSKADDAAGFIALTSVLIAGFAAIFTQI